MRAKISQVRIGHSDAVKRRLFFFTLLLTLSLTYGVLEGLFILFGINNLTEYLRQIEDNNANWNVVILPVVSMLAIWLAQNLISFLSEILRAIFENLYTRRQLKRIFDHLAAVDQKIIDTSNTGEIVGKTIEDSRIAFTDFMEPAFQMAIAITTLISTTWVLATLSWRPTLIVLGMAIVIGIITALATNKQVELNEKARTESSSLWGSFYDAFKNMKFIKSNNLQKMYSNTVNSKVLDYQKKGLKAKQFANILNFFDQNLFALSYVGTVAVVLVFWFQDRFQDNPTTTAAIVVSFLFGSWNLRYPVVRVLEQIQVVRLARVSFRRLNEIMDLPTFKPVEKIRTMDSFDITFENVTFGYAGRNKVLKESSFSFKQGNRYAIIGTTGKGKSTIMELIIGMYHPEQGKITVGNLLVNEENVSTIRHHISFTYQLAFLMNDTIEANIKLLNPSISQEELNKILEIAEVNMILSKMPNGLKTMVGESGVHLSVGERKRIQIAQSLCKHAEIYMFDELTASLDEKTAAAIMAKISDYLADKTTIFIEHRLNMIRDIDNIYEFTDATLMPVKSTNQ